MSDAPKPPTGFAKWLDWVIQTSEEKREVWNDQLAFAQCELADLRARVARLEEACKAAYFYMPLVTDIIEQLNISIGKCHWQSVIFQLRDALSEGGAK